MVVGVGGEGVHIGHNARLFVFSLIFIKLNIKELEGRQFVRVREFYSSRSFQVAIQVCTESLEK